MENEPSFRKAIIHNPYVPVRRKRKPLKVSKDMQRKIAEEKMMRARARKALDAENKRIAAGLPKESISDAEPLDEEAAAENIEKLNAEIASEAPETPSESSKVYIATKDGKSYAQERHAENLAAKLDLPYDSIKETEDGYVLEVSEDQIPEGHIPVENVNLK